jgi:hypothetical protein
MEAALIVAAISAATVAVCSVAGLRLRLRVVREQLARAPEPTYDQASLLAERVLSRADPSPDDADIETSLGRGP